MDSFLLAETEFAYDGEVLLVRDEGGDTLIPPFQGRWTVLEPVSGLEAARHAAEAWETAR